MDKLLLFHTFLFLIPLFTVGQEANHELLAAEDTGKLILTSFKHFDKRTDSTYKTFHFSDSAEINLFHWDRSFTFEFVLEDYENADSIYYSYQMEGYENTWSEPSKFNIARFTDIPSGTYYFRVKASVSVNIWHPNLLHVKVVVHPPWWASLLAYILYWLAFLGFVIVVIYFLKRRWKLEKQLALEHQEAIRLQELDDFKNKFFTNITHEFRTPLTVILGTNEQLISESVAMSEGNATSVKEKHNLIKRSGENLLRLINQLLDLSKIESKSLNIHSIQGDILPYLRYITESLHSFANTQNITLILESNQANIVMDYDPKQVLQIVYNLLTNAIKFTNAGGMVTLSVSVKCDNVRKAEMLYIEVKDTGIGIAAHDLPFIFDRFYQADNKNSRSINMEGTGVGLSLTKELVNLMNGEITAESEADKGTSILVKLPITNMAVFEEPNVVANLHSSKSRLPKVTTTIEDKSKLKHEHSLLLIEDNPDVVQYLKTCLQENYKLNFAYNGRSGIEKALELIPDLILSDVMMPEKDGFEVTKILKNNELTSHIPIILLTAKADMESRLKGLQFGADAYLSKPFDRSELMVTLANLLKIRKQLQAKFRELGMRKNQSIIPRDSNNFDRSFLNYENAFLQKIISFLEKHLDDNAYSVPQLSREMGLSQSQLYRKIKALTDLSTVAFIRRFRLLKGKEMLERTYLSISEIAYDVGFSTPSYFSNAFAEEFGKRPNEIRE